ncbi:hypothetical protein BH10ACT9_BH10ACT9_38070 [soil metagenome]
MSGLEISRSSERPAVPGPEETFTGDVTVKPLFNPNADRTAAAMR